jgi:hypothetical protein
VTGAKLGAGVVLGVIASVAAIVLAALGSAIAAPDVAHPWALPAGLLVQDLFYVVTPMLNGVAFGAALLASAPAIVLFFGLPAVWSAVGSIHFMHGIANWLDATQALSPLTEVMTATQWAQAGTTLALWLGVPLAIGVWRIRRGDVR